MNKRFIIVLAAIIVGFVAIVLLSRSAGTDDVTTTGSSNVYGNLNSKVTLTEYVDFQCEACYAFYPTVKEVKEATILKLRLNSGIDLIQFEEVYQINLRAIFGNAIETSISDKLLLLEDGNLKLTDKGRLLSNEVFVRIMNEKDSVVEK